MKLGVETYHQLGSIHPFHDGNGRVARLSMNYLLRRYGLGYVVFPALDESGVFWDLLLRAKNDGLEGLITFARQNTFPV